MKAVIGITIDYSEKEQYARYPWYALRADYANAVVASGGVPMLLPYELSVVEYYAEMIDGLLLTGGDFDIHPRHYGQDITSESIVNILENRTNFESELLKKVMERRMPVLGICAGMQLINVNSGGTLIQHLPDIGGEIDHQQPHPKNEPYHSIKVAAGSRLHAIAESDSYMVNSTHHQAVAKVGADLKVTANAKDGVVEAVEHLTHPYCIGVQWHPEYMRSEEDRRLLRSFIEASQIYKASRKA